MKGGSTYPGVGVTGEWAARPRKLSNYDVPPILKHIEIFSPTHFQPAPSSLHPLIRFDDVRPLLRLHPANASRPIPFELDYLARPNGNASYQMQYCIAQSINTFQTQNAAFHCSLVDLDLDCWNLKVRKCRIQDWRSNNIGKSLALLSFKDGPAVLPGVLDNGFLCFACFSKPADWPWQTQLSTYCIFYMSTTTVCFVLLDIICVMYRFIWSSSSRLAVKSSFSIYYLIIYLT